MLQNLVCASKSKIQRALPKVRFQIMPIFVVDVLLKIELVLQSLKYSEPFWLKMWLNLPLPNDG